MKKNAKSMRSSAERAAEWVARLVYDCVVTRKAVKTQFAAVDFFASDIVGKHKDGSHVYIQVTAGQASAVSARKKKLVAFPWHESDEVYLFQLEKIEKQYQFNVWTLIGQEPYRRAWVQMGPLTIEPEWFKKFKEEENG